MYLTFVVPDDVMLTIEAVQLAHRPVDAKPSP
jgi:hypothetical protein